MTNRPIDIDCSTIHGQRAIENAAIIAHEANRYYCAAMGDDSQVGWRDAQEWQRTSALAGVRSIIDNPKAGPGDSHASWLKQKEADGWKYGPVKDTEKLEHPSMLPFSKLSQFEQAKDHLFVSVVRAALYVYGIRHARFDPHKATVFHRAYRTADPIFEAGMEVVMGRACEIAARGIAALHLALGYPAPRGGINDRPRTRMHAILRCCLHSPSPIGARDLDRACDWPTIDTSPMVDAVPVERSLWYVAFGIMKAIQGLEGVELHHETAWMYGGSEIRTAVWGTLTAAVAIDGDDEK